jgi:AraC-like DNA-binding protein
MIGRALRDRILDRAANPRRGAAVAHADLEQARKVGEDGLCQTFVTREVGSHTHEASRRAPGSGPERNDGIVLAATLVAKYLVVDARPSQSAYAISDHLIHADPLVERFERWARARLALGFSLDEAADALATSKRTLARRLKDTLGKTPLSYFQDLRVERAVHLLKTTDHNIERIASMVGYADGVTLRTLARRRLGRGVRELRASA